MTAVAVHVPGKVMLAGEYSVLSGGHALAVSLHRQLTVEVAERPEFSGFVMVESNLWQTPRRVEAGKASAECQDDPLLAAVARGMELHDITGATVKVRSDLDVRFGIGSSSALRLAVLVALQDLARRRRGEPSLDVAALWPMAREALQLQRSAQKQASGYDIATQLVGGLTLFSQDAASHEWPGTCTQEPPGRVDALQQLAHIFVGGRGAPTAPVTTETLTWLQEQGLLPRVTDVTETLIEDFHRALAHPNDHQALAALARTTAVHRQIFTASPHFPVALAAALEALPDCDVTWSFKTTGAGGEDALLVVGQTATIAAARTLLEAAGWHSLDEPFSSTGTEIRRQGATHV